MKPEMILQALSQTRPELLEQAAAERETGIRRIRLLYRAALVAAVLALLVGSVFAGTELLRSKVPAAELHNPGGFDVRYSCKTARRATEDGWVFTFTQNVNKPGAEDGADLIPYVFYGVNLRYRYDDDYIQVTAHRGEDPNPYTQRYSEYLIQPAEIPGSGRIRRELYVPAWLNWGEGSAAQRRDMEQIGAILCGGMTPEELLALDPADYSFESFDKMIFFELMREALTGAPHEEATDLGYWNTPNIALLTEPAWENGCKLQIGLLSEMGCVDELWIDLLYQTGEGYRDYVQLSDLVASGEADAEQREAFALLGQVAERVKDSERFLAGSELYQGRSLAGLDFNRLLRIMTDLHLQHDLSPYYETLEPQALE